MSSDDSQYTSILDNIWPPPNEATQARFRRLRDLEEQRRQHDSSSRSPPTRLRRFPSTEPIRRTRLERRGALEEDTTSADNSIESKEQSASSRQLLRSRSEDVTSKSENMGSQSDDVTSAESKESKNTNLIDSHFEALDNVPDETQEIYNKIRELEEKRKRTLGTSGSVVSEEGSEANGMTARERFFQTYNSRSSIANRDQNRTDQIRLSRLRRRQERSRGGRYSSLTGLDHLRMNIGQDISEESTETKVAATVGKNSSARKSAADTCTEAFTALFPLERGLQKLEELEQLRKRTQQEFENQDSDVRMPRAHSLQPENVSSSSLVLNRYNSFDSTSQPSHTYDPILYGRPLTRSASSDRLIQLREEINSISSTYMPSVGSSFTSSILSDIPSSPLQTETGAESNAGATTSSIMDEPDGVPVYMEGSVQGMPYIDKSGLTHWLGPTSPKYKELYSANMISVRRRSRDTGVGSFIDGASRREAYASSMFPDHFLAPCFEKKYSVEERCELIRKQIYESDIGKSILAKTGERSPPDGASKDTETGDSNAENEIVSTDEQVRES